MPSFDVEDTIAAIASAPGSAMRGIIRISGPNCRAVLTNSFAGFATSIGMKTKSPVVLSCSIPLEEDLHLPGEIVFWPTQRSYTRQPAAEFHTIGSPPLLKLALSKICQSGARLANPGEFTLRAFLSGRLDLTQAEAVLAIIDAEGESQLDGALNQLAGGLTGPLTDARDQLKYVLAELEAGLDFVEDDIEFISQQELLNQLTNVRSTLQKITEQISSRNRETESISVALIGMPNAGKSSLFNCLLDTDRAIVTSAAGTTTDFLTAQFEINGQRLEVVDTAGLEDSPPSRVDSNLAITEQAKTNQTISDRAQAQRDFVESNSQIQLLCIDMSRELTDWELERIANLPMTTVVVQTKSDLPTLPGNVAAFTRLGSLGKFVSTSVVTNSVNTGDSSGIDDLRRMLESLIEKLGDSESEIVGSTALRAGDSLRACAVAVDQAIQAAQLNAGEEIVAAELRTALDNLGLVVGTVYTDDILDVVFSRFCIGK